MSDPVIGTMAYPCDSCGAQAGQDCLEDCPALGAVDFSELDLPDLYAVPHLDDGRAALMSVVRRLPFANLLADPPDWREFDVQEWVARLTDWMRDYQGVAKSEVGKLSADSRRCMGLELERDIVRGFFGMKVER